MQIQPNYYRSSKGRSAPTASLPWDCGKLITEVSSGWSRFSLAVVCGMRTLCMLRSGRGHSIGSIESFSRCKQGTHALPCIVFLAAMSLPSPIAHPLEPNAPPFLHTIGFIKSHFDKRSNISQMVQGVYPIVSTIYLKLQCSHCVAR
jgi:hypothetical protein